MKRSHDSTFPMDESELEAAGILLDLPRLMIKCESSFGFPFGWGAKKQRSYPPDIPLPSLPSVPEAVVAVAPTCEDEKPEVLSPATPLLFSPSESDEKSKHKSRRKVSLKRRKDEYLRIVEELTERNSILKEELKKLEGNYDQQKALNLKLKTTKEKMIPGLQIEQQQPKFPELDHSSPQFDVQDRHRQTPYAVLEQPFITDRTGGQKLPSLSSNSGLLTINNDNPGPSVIPDLNLPAKESGQALNPGIADKSETRALAARARRRRIQICRSKKRTAASKLRNPRL